jgi:protein phosphatase
MLSDSAMESLIAEGGSLDATAHALVEAANENGGRDNITAVLFRLEDDGQGDPRASAETDTYDTIAGDQEAPTSEQIEAERRRISDMDTQARARDGNFAAERPASAPVATKAAGAARIPPRASPRMRPPDDGNRTTSRPRPAPRRRGRWLARSIAAAVVIVALVVGAVYVVSRNVYFVGTNDQGYVTLFRGLPYDLPLDVSLYSQRSVSGVPALSLSAERRERVLDHQLRSEDDALDLVKSLNRAERD